ncbi:AMP-binding protein [Comamonas composti]|uniref:AMP-binding protein n=1 Tax=Comamonas composti TaxID=408558 RepID=UPI00054E74D5|nr:AMP-binding protein [Comamonas composti]
MQTPILSLADIEAYEQALPLSARIADTIHQAFVRTAQRHGKRPALSMVLSASPDETPLTLNYEQLLGAITQTANAFADLAGPGAGIAYLLPNLPQTHMTLWGAATSGHAVPLNPLLQTEHLVALLEAAEARVLVGGGPAMAAPLWEKCLAIQAAMPQLKLVAVDLPGQPAPAGALSFDALRKAQPADQLMFDSGKGPDALASYFHTGGTTGVPKLVAHTQRNELTAALGAAALMNLDEEDAIANGLPLFHVASAMACSLSAFLTGAHVLILSPQGLRNPEMIRGYWSIVQRMGVTIAGAVPTSLAPILDAGPVPELPHLRCCITGSAPTPRALAERFARETRKPLYEVLGMTESGGVTAIDPLGGEPSFCSVGFRIPYSELRVRRPLPGGGLGPDCAPGEVGHLFVRGPSVSPGYKNAAQNAGTFVDGGLDSGDLAYLDEQGKLFIAGRSKDVIIRSGHNIDPGMIEEAMTRHPDVAYAAAVSQPDGYAGELPVCYVSLAPGARADAPALQALQEHAQQHIAERPAWPRHIYVLPQLPMTSVGKIFKPALREDAACRLLEPQLRQSLGELLAGIDAKEGGKRGLRVTVSLSREDAAARQAAQDILASHTFEHAIVVQG